MRTDVELYKDVMATLASGGQVSREDFDRAVDVARRGKRKQPRPEPGQVVADVVPIQKAAKPKPAVKREGPKPKPAKAAKPAEPKRSKDKGPCAEPGCEKQAKTKGKCHLHYVLDWRAANPEKMEAAKERARQRREARKAAEAADK